MIHMFKRLLDFSAAERKKLILSFIFHMCNSVFEMLPIMAVLTVLNGIWCSFSNGHMPAKTIWVSFGIMLLSILGRILFTNLSSVKRTLGSFSIGLEILQRQLPPRWEIWKLVRSMLWKRLQEDSYMPQ